MRVEVAYVAPGIEVLVEVQVADEATLGDALRAASITERIAFTPDANAYAIFGKRAALDTRLREGDRVEITRPLVCDPKVARRIRAKGPPSGKR